MNSPLKRKLRLSAAACAFILAAACQGPGLAQETLSPSSKPGSKPSQGEEESPEQTEFSREKEKSGFFRIWNFAYSSKETGLAILLVPAGEKMPPPDKRNWIARGSRAPETRSYREVETGKYTLYLLRDGSKAGKPDPSINGEDIEGVVQKKLDLEIEKDSYQTLLLTGEETTTPATELLNDSKLTGTLPKLRIYNFVLATRPTFTAFLKGKRVTFLNNLETARYETNMQAAERPLVIEMTSLTAAGATARQTVQIGGEPVKSYSLLIAPDRYGRTSVLPVSDAPKVPPDPPSEKKKPITEAP